MKTEKWYTVEEAKEALYDFATSRINNVLLSALWEGIEFNFTTFVGHCAVGISLPNGIDGYRVQQNENKFKIREDLSRVDLMSIEG